MENWQKWFGFVSKLCCRVAGHTVAGGLTIAFFTVLMALFYIYLLVAAMVTNEGIGSPAMVVLSPIMGAIFGLAIAISFFLVSMLMEAALSWFRWGIWVSPLVVGIIALALSGWASIEGFAASGDYSAFGLFAIAMLYAGGFACYWFISQAIGRGVPIAAVFAWQGAKRVRAALTAPEFSGEILEIQAVESSTDAL